MARGTPWRKQLTLERDGQLRATPTSSPYWPSTSTLRCERICVQILAELSPLEARAKKQRRKPKRHASSRKR
jgi:hypothetical protein